MKKLSGAVVLVLVAAVATIGASRATAVETPPPPPPNNPYCIGTYTGVTFNQVIVPQGQQCVLDSVLVNGATYANPDSSLIICNSRLLGGLRGTRAYINVDNASYVAGSIDIIPPMGSIVYEGTQGTACDEEENECEYEYACEELQYESSNSAGTICPYKVVGGINIHNGGPNSDSFFIGECGPMYIKDGVSIVYNNVPVYITNATIKGDLRCFYNNPWASAGEVYVAGRRSGEYCVPAVQKNVRG